MLIDAISIGGIMITCQECGFKTTRLQWTHFKYKCAGHLKNIKEYTQKYPNAPLVDEELKKRTAVTLDAMLSKYGQIEGMRRWEDYRSKQAASNSFEYKSSKHGWSKAQFDDYNKSRAVTVENLVARHGEHEGLLRWEKYCDRQAYTCTREYMIEEYGDAGERRWDEWQVSKRECALNRPDPISGTSKKEIEVFDVLISMFNLEVGSRNRWFYDDNISNKRNIDYLDYRKNIAIEFYGDYYHMNPVIYEPSDYNSRIRKTAEEKWVYDQETRRVLNSRGIALYVIWELDWIKNKDFVMKDISKWLLSHKAID
jgi:hypothetical protein